MPNGLWTAVERQMPQRGDWVLGAWTEDASGMAVMQWDGHEWCCLLGILPPPTHWVPLPDGAEDEA